MLGRLVLSVVIVLYGFVVPGTANNNRPFPWSKKLDALSRNEFLLDEIQKFHFSMEIEDSILASLDTNISYVINDSTGKKLEISIVEDISNSSQIMLDPNVAISGLDGTCIEFRESYWTYELCHRSEIHQFHVEGGRGPRSPNYSLGTFNHSEVYWSNEPDRRIKRVVDYYEDGQICHETKSNRRTEVSIQCCEGEPVLKDIKQTSRGHRNLVTNGKSKLRDDPESQMRFNAESDIRLISEVSCNYSMVLCYKPLCSIHSASSKAPLTLRSLMQNLSSTCLYRQEEWWTYELCFNGSIHQFHIATQPITKDTGVVEMKKIVDNSYVLGNAPTQLLVDEQRLKDCEQSGFEDTNDQDFRRLNAKNSLISFNQAKELWIEYDGGVACDLLNVNRSATVKILCGEKKEFVSIVEDKTCHYIITATIPEICKHPGYSPKKTKYRLVDIENIDSKMRSSPQSLI